MREWFLTILLALGLNFSLEDVARFDVAKVGDYIHVNRLLDCNVCTDTYMKVSETEVRRLNSWASLCTLRNCPLPEKVEKFK